MRKYYIWLKVLLLFALLIVRGFDLFEFHDLLEYGPIVSGVYYIAIYLLSIEILRSLVLSLYRSNKGMDPMEKDNFTLGISNLFVLLYTFGLFFLILAVSRVQVTNFIFSVSIVAAAIAIVAKDFISDIISSMFMTFSSELEVGDIIKMGEYKGKIVNMTLNKTTILTDEDDLIFFPNSKVYFSEIVNYTKRDIKKTSISFELSNGIVDDIIEIEDLLKDALSNYNNHIRPESYNLKILEIKKDYVNFKFQYVLFKHNHELEKEIRRKVIRTIFHRLNVPKAEGNSKTDE